MVDTRRIGGPTARVLLACSDEVYASSLEHLLREQGMEVTRCEPQHASAELRRCLSLADVLVVEASGLVAGEWRLVEEIRAVAPLLEIVAISSGPVVRDAVRALRSGVFAVLEYPVSSSQLVHTIGRAYARKRSAEARIRQLNGGDRRTEADPSQRRSE